MAIEHRHTLRGRLSELRASKPRPGRSARRLLLPKAIKGDIIYRNPNAKPVGPRILEREHRVPFTLENVEWISMHPREIGVGGFGACSSARPSSGAGPIR